MRHVLSIVLLLLALTLVGTVGFKVVDPPADWIDCLYMAVITLTTVGYRESIQVEGNPAAKLFVIVYLICGLSVFTYSAYHLGQWVVSVEMRSILERRRMQNSISKLHNHYIVCGLGRMGTIICETLQERGKPFIVIDIDEERLAEVCAERNWLHLEGDATDDSILENAGIARARSLASVLPTDADNVYVVLSARMLSPELQIIVRAGGEKAVSKLQRAGATRVVSPFSTGAQKMARFMVTPSIEDFLEIADSRGNELELADVHIEADSPFIGKQLQQTDLREKGVMVIGIRRADGERLMPPPGSAVIEQGDSLFAFGSTEAVNRLIGQIDQHE
jgi:voltage-gated potassium channel